MLGVIVLQHLNDILEWRQFTVTQLNTIVVKRHFITYYCIVLYFEFIVPHILADFVFD